MPESGHFEIVTGQSARGANYALVRNDRLKAFLAFHGGEARHSFENWTFNAIMKIKKECQVFQVHMLVISNMVLKVSNLHYKVLDSRITLRCYASLIQFQLRRTVFKSFQNALNAVRNVHSVLNQ